MANPTPTDYGRSRALQALVERAEMLADQPQADAPGINDDDRAYLRSYVATCRSIADWLRRSPGYEP